MFIDHDLHIHTHLSSCCKDKEKQRPPAILALAENMGVQTVGFADHVWANPDLEPSAWYVSQGASRISQLREDLAAISSRTDVLVGCEAETVAPGKFGVTRQFVRELDFVLLSCSHFHMKEFVAQPESDAPRHVAKHMLAFFRSGVLSGLATSIAHPLFPLGYLETFDAAIDAISDAELQDAFGLARDRAVALEITVSFLPSESRHQFSIETPIRFLSLAKQAGCKFTLGSDSHDPEKQKRLPELATLLDAVGVMEDDLLPKLRIRRQKS